MRLWRPLPADFGTPHRSCLRSSVGVVIAYAANHNMSLHIKSTRRLINTNIRDLKTFANNTPSVRQGVPGHRPTELTGQKKCCDVVCVFLI